MTVVVFTGPTLSPIEAEARLNGGLIMPPARQGDIWRAVRAHRPAAIGLIDGVFLHEPAVWHREILWALAEGVHVFGGASMGALRAAELAPFGMQGVGKVFAAFRDGIWPGFSEPFEDDDEVAVVHAPPELGHAPMSDAMVDLRDTLLAASESGVITASQALSLVQRLKTLPFGERSFSKIAVIGAECLDPSSLAALLRWLPRGVVPRKRLDAIAVLDRLQAFAGDRPEPFQASFRLEHVQVWHDFVTAPEPLTTDEALVLEEAKLCTGDWNDMARAALGRLRAVAAAAPSTGFSARTALQQFRLKRGLVRRADLDAWLVENAAGPEWLERTMAEEAAVTASLVAPPPGLDAAIVDHLRLTDRFAGLLQRALTKRDTFAAIRPPLFGPEMDAALIWHAERTGQEQLTLALSEWADEASFRLAVWREYMFVHAVAQ